MKHDQLCAIAHNLADSMASGLAFLIGYHPVDVYADAARSVDGMTEVDFIRGEVVHGYASDDLRSAAHSFAEILPSFCRENGTDISDFTALSVKFHSTPTERRATVYVADRKGRATTTEFGGTPLQRVKVLDNLGRVRRIPRQSVTASR